MKRSLVAIVAVLAMASLASGAQVVFFLASPQSQNAATNCLAAAAAMVNPVLPPGPGLNETDVCMMLTAAQLPAGWGQFGGAIDVAYQGGAKQSDILVAHNPSSRWGGGVANGVPGFPGYKWVGYMFNAVPPGVNLATVPVPAMGEGLLPNGNLVLLLARGRKTDLTDLGGLLWMELPFGAAFGSNDPLTGSHGVAFGWTAAGGAPDLSSSVDGGGPAANYDPNDPSLGWLGDGSVGAIRSIVPDMIKLPEPATLALLGLGGLLIRRRK